MFIRKLTRNREIHFFIIQFFRGTNYWNKLFDVFADCLQMMKLFLLCYSYENAICFDKVDRHLERKKMMDFKLLG